MKKKMKHKTIMLTILVLCLVCIVPPLQVEAQPRRLAAEEREVLLEIGLQLGKKGWNLDVDPCNDTTWSTAPSGDEPLYNNTVVCNCSYPDGLCHVVKIFLKGQDLAGELPSSIAKLPYLTAIDFMRNYLTGNIPSAWASTKLEYL
uniref:probable LRR receptor-like serine/threonine-protein kinase At1g07650 n=1 Tax=Fragaria vesca subsp. vesca TaxID=101020 RepID=UPI0005C9C528|nr:PREDICTED: probable LRR receptor-like serine/threonine-protein kinase At1g07650 [Fragaria vesca subsp. vesca]